MKKAKIIIIMIFAVIFLKILLAGFGIRFSALTRAVMVLPFLLWGIIGILIITAIAYGIWKLLSKFSKFEYFEVPFPMSTALCSDNQCPCSETPIPRGSGYLYISQDVVNNRRNARSESEAAALATKLTREYEKNTGAVVMMDFKDILTPILMCEEGARKRGLDLEIASSDAKYWWQTGKVPLRPTPKSK